MREWRCDLWNETVAVSSSALSEWDLVCQVLPDSPLSLPPNSLLSHLENTRVDTSIGLGTLCLFSAYNAILMCSQVSRIIPYINTYYSHTINLLCSIKHQTFLLYCSMTEGLPMSVTVCLRSYCLAVKKPF